MRVIRAMATGAVLALAACGGGDDGPTGPGPGSGPMSATVDGQAWQSTSLTSLVGTSAQAPGMYVITGAASGTAGAITLSLMGIPGPGTYPLGTGVGVSGGNGIFANPTAGWSTPLSGQAGTITLTTVTPTRIAGTFAFTADQATGNASGAKVITGGAFDLPITTPVSSQPVPTSSQHRVTATIGGQSYSAATIAAYPTPATLFGFASATNRAGITLNVQNLAAPGTFPLGPGSGVATMGVNGECTPGGAPNCAWSSAAVGSTGTITIASISNGRITGTFSGTLGSVGVGGAATMTVANGTFDIGIQ